MKPLVFIAALCLPWFALSADEKATESSPSSTISNLLSSLRENVKDIDMSAIPKQLTEMKENYAAQGQTIADLKAEVEALKKEMAALRKEVADLKGKKKI
jgi:polyhydroxyalkanoate synthesis regulator phasin